ncbi:MAG: menaquinone biosynthesis decarboxylase [Clostridia bacterium]|nr:menaquinone biosynthesis decarboxylase [Clostridia bacterium]
MAFNNLRDFIGALEQRGQLQRIPVEVDPILEIAAISDKVVKAGGPALFFEQVKGSPYPVVTNLFGTPERTALALGISDLKELEARVREVLTLPSPQGWWGKLKELPRLLELSKLFPVEVKKAPCQEVVETDRPSLEELPVLKCWPQDGGRFITLPLVITKDPETGRQNLGMYRMQVFDSRTAGMHWHPHKDGAENYRRAGTAGNQSLPVAVALGADPATIYAATAPLPLGVDELLLAGFLRRQPVPVVKARTVDLLVPAEAEFILEGYVNLEERRPEGPFGDHTGFYTPTEMYPVFHLTAITHRAKPLYPATVVGRPPMEDYFLGKVTERLFLPFIQLVLPEVVDFSFPLEGTFHNCAVVSIRKSYPGHARKVMHALWGLGQMMYTKTIIVVDAHVDVQDMSQVWWRVFNNVDPRRDLVITDGPLDALDHSSPQPLYGAKLGIDATSKGPSEGHHRPWPSEIEVDPATKDLIAKRWKEYGFD